MEKADNCIRARKAYSQLGISYMVVDFAAMMLGSMFVTKVLGYEDNVMPDNMEILYDIIIRFVVILPLVYLAIRKLPRFEIEKKKLGIKNFLKCVSVDCSLKTLAAIFTFALISVISAVTGIHTVNPIIADVSSMSMLRQILVVCIIAPVFEELLYRKLLIDRIAHYGEVAAMLLSGIMFGLAHGNFYQFFFTTVAGCFFAFVYLRTGKIQYTIFMHMITNSFNTIIRVIVSLIEGNNKTVAYAFIAMFAVVVISFTVLGIVFMVRDRKRFFFEHHEEEAASNHGGATAVVNAGMILYILVFFGKTLLTFLGTSYTELLLNSFM